MSVDEVKGENMPNKTRHYGKDANFDDVMRDALGDIIEGNATPAPEYAEPTDTESIFVCEVCQKPAIAGVVDYRRYHEDGVLKYGELATHFFCAEHKRDAVYTDG